MIHNLITSPGGPGDRHRARRHPGPDPGRALLHQGHDGRDRRGLRRRAQRPLLLPRLLARRLRHARRAARPRRPGRDRPPAERAARGYERYSPPARSTPPSPTSGRRRRAPGVVRRPAGVELDDLDGLTVAHADWWFNVRASNTEPLLRLNAEGADEATMTRVRDDVLTIESLTDQDRRPSEARPSAARDHRLPGLPRQPGRRRARSWSARRAAWPTRSATTSRCCWSTRPGSRTEPRWPPTSTSPGSTTSGALGAADLLLRSLAESGARVRREAAEAAEATSRGVRAQPRQPPPRGDRGRPGLAAAARRPRAVVPGAVRGLARPRRCPGWAGSLDLVVDARPRALRPGAPPPRSPRRYGGAARWSSPAPPDSMVAEHAAGRWTTILPSRSGDQLATAVVMLDYLHRVEPRPAHRPRGGGPGARRRGHRLLAAPRPRGQPRQDAGHRPGRHQPAGLGRLGAGRPRRAPGRGVAAPGRAAAAPSPATPSTCCR